MTASHDNGRLIAAAAAPPAGDDPADAQLVDAVRRGDRTAFARLYERYAPMVHGVLLARVGPAEADDLVQEVFIKAWRNIGTIRDVGSLGAWLGTIARHKAADRRRAVRRADRLLATIPAREEVAEERDSGGGGAEILAAIRELPEAYRETLVLRLVEGMTGPQIAARMGMTEGSVRVNLHRGMKQLRERLTPEYQP